jgi:hypothetical protein
LSRRRYTPTFLRDFHDVAFGHERFVLGLQILSANFHRRFVQSLPNADGGRRTSASCEKSIKKVKKKRKERERKRKKLTLHLALDGKGLKVKKDAVIPS